jgi:hypothetical protein
MLDDRRASERHECSQLGKLIAAGMQEPVDCIVRDVSRLGALIVVKNAAAIPGSFKLMITGIERSRDCEVTRRAAQTLGVRFTG